MASKTLAIWRDMKSFLRQCQGITYVIPYTRFHCQATHVCPYWNDLFVFATNKILWRASTQDRVNVYFKYYSDLKKKKT